MPLRAVMAQLKRDLAHVAAAGLRVGTGIRNRSVAHVFKTSLKHLDNPLRMREIVRVEKTGAAMNVVVLNPDVVAYYARTVAHLFPEPAVTADLDG